jgi:hypothetical protein
LEQVIRVANAPLLGPVSPGMNGRIKPGEELFDNGGGLFRVLPDFRFDLFQMATLDELHPTGDIVLDGLQGQHHE